MLDVCKSFISYPNYFEFVDHIRFHSINDRSLYDDYTHNLFKSNILLLDALLSFEIEVLIQLFVKRLSLVFKYIANQNNVDNKIEINERWDITLLDKKQLYRNKEAFPNFDYKTKGLSKRLEKVIKFKDSQFKIFRNIVPNLIKLKDKNIGKFITNFIFIWILLNRIWKITLNTNEVNFHFIK